MAKIPGVTSEILKKKVLEALEGIGIKASDIMGKGTNVKRLTQGSDINPFKPNMLQAMRSQNKTMGDALDAFANEAKFIMNANDAETLNFLNNLNTYKNIVKIIKNSFINILNTNGILFSIIIFKAHFLGSIKFNAC